MKNNTNPQFHFETIYGEPHLVLTFSDRKWLEENLWISERDLCCAEMLDAIPHDLRIEINYPKFVKALNIVKEYSDTVRDVQIDCGVSSQHFDNSTNKTLFNHRLLIPRPIGTIGYEVAYQFYVLFSENDTDFDYELSLDWSMLLGIDMQHDYSLNILLEQLCDMALEAGVISSIESQRAVLCL